MQFPTNKKHISGGSEQKSVFFVGATLSLGRKSPS